MYDRGAIWHTCCSYATTLNLAPTCSFTAALRRYIHRRIKLVNLAILET